jgi:UDP:flavonoid glycosyltransferase YjiC (YdhE family)
VSARVLFTCWPFEGHVFPLLSIALAERDRAGAVAFYTGKRLAPTVASQGIEVFPFDRVEGVWDRVHEREREPRSLGRSLRVQREAFREWLIESIPDQVADLRAVMDRWRPDVIVTDGSMWGPSLVFHEATPIPICYASTLLYALIPGPDAPPAGSRMGPPRSSAQKLRARAVTRVIDLLAHGARKRLDEIRAGYALGPMGCSVNAYCARLPLYLIGSDPELDFGRTDLPPSVHYVGPLMWHPPEPSSTLAWLEQIPTERPWVHVTEGTSHFEQPFLLRAASRAFAGAPLEAILTTGDDRDVAALGLGSLAPNVHVENWLSHSELLPRCRVVVTTGGAHTTISALAAGVPIVIVPTSWDKPENARRLVEAGVAVRLSRRGCTPETLRAAVERVVADPTYRSNARRIATQLAARPGPAGAAALIEETVPAAGPRAVSMTAADRGKAS